MVEPAFERPGDNEATRRWCAQVLGMYRAWADNRHMQLAEIAGGAARNLPWLLISGFGAHRLLAQEVGLHVLELADDDERLRPGGRAGAARRRSAGRSAGRQAPQRAGRRAAVAGRSRTPSCAATAASPRRSCAT